MRNLCMTVSYDGTSYYGFQSQPDGNTVQDTIQEALLKLTGEPVLITGSGRTDAGVHARAQVFNFHTTSPIPVHHWTYALNTRLPTDIVIQGTREAQPTFHARHCARGKTYRYTIDNGRIPNVFRRHYQYHHPAALDWEAMEEALPAVLGEHDFTSFCSAKSQASHHVRTVDRIEWVIDSEFPQIRHLYISGNGFLYNMVRVIVGTLLVIGRGRRSSADMARILQAQNRSLAGPTALAQGLTLWEVRYAESDFLT